MYGFYVILSAETASFRDPGGQLYHATLPLPPVSTIIGIAGAALGVDFEEIWEFFKEHDIRVGVRKQRGNTLGKGLDLWKYQKIVSREVRNDIVKREFLFQPAYYLYYGCEKQDIVKTLHQAFIDPAWALSLGTSDDIAVIKKISSVEIITEEESSVGHCLVLGDHTEDFSFDWEVIRNTPIRTSLKLPMVKQLPIDFVFTGGERKGMRYVPFTFLSEVQCLKNSYQAYSFGEEAIQLISLLQG